MAYKYLLYLSFFTMIASNGCHCKKNEPTPVEIEKNVFDFFPNNNNKQWIYEVQRTDYTVSPPVLKYAYDDTLYFEKDTNLRKDTISKLMFKVYKFKKGNLLQRLVIGQFPIDPPILYQWINGIACQLYDIDAIEEHGAPQSFTTDGKPIDNRISAKYYSPYTQNYSTAIGNYKIINSNMTFEEYNTGRYYVYKHSYKFAEKVGPVEYTFDFKLRNTDFGIDSFYTAYYKIKKVIN